jgi:hypothetical protein
MDGCVCVCVHVCVCVCACVCVHVRMCVCVCMCVCARARAHAHLIVNVQRQLKTDTVHPLLEWKRIRKQFLVPNVTAKPTTTVVVKTPRHLQTQRGRRVTSERRHVCEHNKRRCLATVRAS